MIQFHNVSFSYASVPVVDDLTFECADGGVVWLAGDNGTGKSTTVHLALRLLNPNRGQIESPSAMSAVFQEDRLCEHLTAVANIRLGLGRKATNQEILAELERVGLAELDAGRPVGQLSGGQRRRVALVRALLRPAGLTCLDEPYTGIDEASLDQVIAYTQERITGKSVILVCHDTDIAERFNPYVVRM
ncbi:MAG: ATP-binding cassette domain-containing protein [Propionibacteriaceae bacterium]|nr:ATP-binding cassette domain-containing protein [Propionibacteriaceae bacterium]